MKAPLPCLLFFWFFAAQALLLPAQAPRAYSAQTQKALEYYNRAIRHQPHSGLYYQKRGDLYFTEGTFDLAMSDYGAAIRYYHYDPARQGKAFYQRGLCAYILADYAAAEEDFTQAIERRPHDAQAWYFRGKIRFQTSHRRSAGEDDLQQVIRLSPEPGVHRVFAQYLLGQVAAAAEDMRFLQGQVTPRVPREYNQLYYNLAAMQAMIGRAGEAVRHLRVALEHGYREFGWLERDPNFAPIASHPGFQGLLQEYDLRYLPGPGTPLAYEPTAAPSRGPVPQGRQPSAPASLAGFDLGFEDPNANNRIEAGEKTFLTFTLANRGQGAAHEVTLLLTEETGLGGLSFPASIPVGAMAPGEQRRLRLPITGEPGMATGVAEFRISIREANGFDGSDLQISVPAQAFQPPVLTVPDHHFSNEMGGRMRLGVPLTLKAAVQNTGAGPARSVSVALSLPENVFSAGQTRLELGDLAPGESAVVEFEFFTNKRYDRDAVPVRLRLEEAGGTGTTETFTVRVDQMLEINDKVVISAMPIKVDVKDIQLISDVDRDLPRTQMSRPDAVAVIIGNRDYENRDVPPVDFALQDAASMRKYLVESFGFDDNNIIFLPNATQADFNGIFGTKEDHRARLFNLVKPGETDVFVFYSGHGAPDVQREQAYFVPVDCDPSLVRFNGYSIETFYQNLGKMPYRSLHVVIDACFSGMSDRGTLLPNASLVRIKTANPLFNDPKAVVLTSATGGQIASWYPDQSHGLFTYYYLKALQGAANTDQDRSLTLGELRAYLQQQVPYQARRLNNREQTPEIYGQDAKVILEY